MSFNDAHAFAFSLATTLMVAIAIFRAGDGTLSVMPAVEYDGDDDLIVCEIDPLSHHGAKTIAAERKSCRFPLPPPVTFAILCDAPMWRWKASLFEPFLTGTPP